MSRCALLTVCVCSAFIGPPVASAGEPLDYLNPPQGTFVDDWLLVELEGNKAGYSHSTMTREGDVIATRSLTYFKIGRANQTVEIRMVTSTRETLSGVPLSFDNTTLTAAVETKTRGVIKDGRADITSSQFGIATTQKGRVPEGAKMAWGMFRATIEHGIVPGTTYDLEVYEPVMQTDGAVKAHVVIGNKQTITVQGKPREATKVTISMQMAFGAVDSVGFVDENGQMLRMETNLAGMVMTMRLADKKTALADFSAPEFFMDTLVKVNRSIDRDTAKLVRYKLSVVGADQKMPELPETSMQKPGVHTDRSVLVEVRRLDHDALRETKPGTTPDSMDEYLAASPSLNAKDEEIVRMAKEAAGDTTHPYALADKLRAFVSRVITEKNLNIGFATASEVCRNRAGDCTEHAVLLAALGRARKLPSRVVVGLAYVPNFVGVQNVFGFHMWTQFYIGDKWVDFDAALQETDCSPARIALATSSLKDSAIGDIAMAIMDVVRGLEIEIVKIEFR